MNRFPSTAGSYALLRISGTPRFFSHQVFTLFKIVPSVQTTFWISLLLIIILLFIINIITIINIISIIIIIKMHTFLIVLVH